MFDSTPLSNAQQTNTSSPFLYQNSNVQSGTESVQNGLRNSQSATQKNSFTHFSQAFGKASNKSNEWKTCSQNFLKKYKPDLKDYDIINLQGQDSGRQSSKTRAPIRNLFNIINNEKLPNFYIRNRSVKLPLAHQRKGLASYNQSYDIISGATKGEFAVTTKYEQERLKTQVLEDYQETHDYDKIFCRFYDENKELRHQASIRSQEKDKVQSMKSNFPPSYVNREPLILDQTKPLPESLRILDQKRLNAKKRFQMKYDHENKYEKKNEQLQYTREAIIRNKGHHAKLLESRKEFNIINNDPSFSQKACIPEQSNSLIKSSGFRA